MGEYEYWQPFVEAAAATGIGRVDDYNGAVMEGASLLQTTTRKGRRHSTADAFLKPVRKRQNLTVQAKAHARRIVVDNGRCGRGRARQGHRAGRA